EARAFACCIAEWLNRNPQRSWPGRCFGCGAYESSHDRLLPIGIGGAGQVWLHSGCSSAWYAGRQAEAIAALATMGIRASANLPNDFGKNGSAKWAVSDRDGRAGRGATRWKRAARST